MDQPALISLAGLDKGAVLAALYNASKPLGMGFLHFTPADMTVEEARKHLVCGDDHEQAFPGFRSGDRHYFDYLNGRVMKVDLSGDELDPRLYDRDNGKGAAERAIAPLRTAPEPFDPARLLPVVADGINRLLRRDVYRLLSLAPEHATSAAADWIIAQRPDLEATVHAAVVELAAPDMTDALNKAPMD